MLCHTLLTCNVERRTCKPVDPSDAIFVSMPAIPHVRRGQVDKQQTQCSLTCLCQVPVAFYPKGRSSHTYTGMLLLQAVQL